jgi:hypothetical protein
MAHISLSPLTLLARDRRPPDLPHPDAVIDDGHC